MGTVLKWPRKKKLYSDRPINNVFQLDRWLLCPWQIGTGISGPWLNPVHQTQKPELRSQDKVGMTDRYKERQSWEAQAAAWKMPHRIPLHSRGRWKPGAFENVNPSKVISFKIGDLILIYPIWIGPGNQAALKTAPSLAKRQRAIHMPPWATSQMFWQLD